ncbi:hypothetical protein QQF64_035784 [Cirrhinus molitorella]|uniref:Uncharacterized protein n=1 Tax=Cirrhinus molitorella TaxID=172907 RepID=A0ABR3NGR6_9TELE
MAKSVRTDMLTVYAIGWNQRKDNALHIALSSRFKKTVEKTLEVTTSLKKMQDQLHCSDDMLKQWIVDVKQWASSGYPNGFTEEGSKGLISLLKRRLHDLRLKQQTVACMYCTEAFLNQFLGWWKWRKRKWRKKWTGNMTSS